MDCQCVLVLVLNIKGMLLRQYNASNSTKKVTSNNAKEDGSSGPV